MNARSTQIHSDAETTPVSRIMCGDVVCATPELAVETFAAMMLDRNISGAPVVDATGKPIGVVSKTDLLRERTTSTSTRETVRMRANRELEVAEALGTGFHVEDLPQTTVGEVMTPVAFTLSESAPIAQAAALMAYEGIHRIPIVSRDGGVVGIVSSLDVLRWLAEQCGYPKFRRDPEPLQPLRRAE